MSNLGSSAGRTPWATYRLQFNRQFTFAQAAELVPYLHELGISDAYASPLFQARPESLHGYDVCDFTRLNPALGLRAQFEQFTTGLQQLGMGLLLDIVPNHMGADLSNEWWLDVLRSGLASPYAHWFDIDWQAPGCEGKVTLPLLEDDYGTVLATGKLRLGFDGEFSLAYYERKFPVSSRSYFEILQALLAWGSNHRRSHKFLGELEQLVRDFHDFQERGGFDGVVFRKLRLHTQGLIRHSVELGEDLADLLETLNGETNTPASFDRLHSILQQQHYRLADWRIGPEEINYRRFFDITDLVSLRMERREVFEATHRLILELIRERRVTGLRIDHPDGLWNPRQYFERLQAAVGMSHTPLYVVIEKILTGDEVLRVDWPVAGTTGYDFLNRVNGLFVDSDQAQDFDALYRDFTGCQIDCADLVYTCKKQVLFSSFIGELGSLARRLQRLAGATLLGQDFSLKQLETVLVEVIACFPVYRTYLDEKTDKITAMDRDHCVAAIDAALARAPGLDHPIAQFLKQVLLLEPFPDFGSAEIQAAREFVMRFQQLTSPLMAKGLEDTAFYNFNRLISLNEVGGNPDQFGTDVQVFHAYNAAQFPRWPGSLLATATHDTKRGEDARARINVLSEMPQQWAEALALWSRINREKKQMVDSRAAPHPNDEYLFYQALLGAWTTGAETADGLRQLRERLSDYMLKAVREAKTHSSWTRPNSPYEDAVHDFVEQLLDSRPDNRFLHHFKPFQRRIAFYGQFNSLSQTLLKMTSPGVPDFYQGAELWDFNLVDPDNRRPVDYSRRRRLLVDLKARFSGGGPEASGSLIDLLDPNNSGEAKLFLIWRTLQFRRNHAALFQQGNYLPLSAVGSKQKHVCAFARVMGKQAFVTVAPRLVVGLVDGAERSPMGKEVWHETKLQLPVLIHGKQYQNVLTGELHIIAEPNTGLLVGDVLAHFPVALLQRI
ncbi:MAG TPA: malto-oligosyltrehalose synthase [Candidatus Limnocylindrales bacterium]|jgi:(1->4)-alpha-D-glucan 1-alpha-D-glucosylmutase|nr:malto-oligosyltrehalose synthase [Candidatus Limnocylindrales bacterium]